MEFTDFNIVLNHLLKFYRCEHKVFKSLDRIKTEIKELEKVKFKNIQLHSRIRVLQIELAHKNAADSKINFKGDNDMELENFENPAPKSQTDMIMVNKDVWEKLQEELEEARQIVNSERHKLIIKNHLVGISGNEEKRLDYLQRKIKNWWPRVTEDDKKRFDDMKLILKRKIKNG